MSLREAFKPFLSQIAGCWCDTCAFHALGTVPTVLLAELRAGKHVYVTREEYAAQARAYRDERIAEARAAGASDEYVATLERGYAKWSMKDFYSSGLGIGMTPRC